MAQAVVDVNMYGSAASNLHVPKNPSRNYVDVKVKRSFFAPLSQKRLGSTHSMQILNESEAQHVILNRLDSFEQLNIKFPSQVKRKILFSLTSEFFQKSIQLYIIKVDVEPVRFGLLVDGQDSNQITTINGSTS